jgi:hypothetical protein
MAELKTKPSKKSVKESSSMELRTKTADVTARSWLL